VLVALFIFGPDRLPKLINDGIRLLRRVRTMARDATEGLSRELGTQVTLEDLHPKTFIRKHVLSDEEQAALRKPLDDLSREVRTVESDVRRVGSDLGTPADSGLGAQRTGEQTASDQPRRHQADPDAT
jgi:sec-independent protein translocase protein TatB